MYPAVAISRSVTMSIANWDHVFTHTGSDESAAQSNESARIYDLSARRNSPANGLAAAESEEMRAIRRLTAQYVRERVQRHEIVKSSARRMRTVLSYFAQSYGGRDPAKMGRKDVERWLATRAHLGAGTRRNEVVIVRGFVKWLREMRILKADPMLGIKSPKVPRAVPRALTDDEARRLWFALPDPRARAIVALMIGVGLRREEVITVQVGDWDRGGRTLRVLGKGGHVRLLPVPQAVAAVLELYVSHSAGPMIRREDGVHGISNSYVGRLMRTWMESAGIKNAAFDGKACHSLRHTLASRVADREPDLRVLQQILGHVSLTSTQIYLRHAEMGKLRAAMEGAA